MERTEAIKILKEFHDKSALFSMRTALETALPELAESEDVRIRKHIISVLEGCWQTCKNIGYDSSRIQEDIDWLEKQEQNPTWSEEDEVKFQNCLYILQAKGLMGATETTYTKWLKSLKQRYTWKPSEDQMDAMQIAVSYFGYSWVSKEQELLESLYKDLKKLTEG